MTTAVIYKAENGFFFRIEREEEIDAEGFAMPGLPPGMPMAASNTMTKVTSHTTVMSDPDDVCQALTSWLLTAKPAQEGSPIRMAPPVEGPTCCKVSYVIEPLQSGYSVTHYGPLEDVVVAAAAEEAAWLAGSEKIKNLQVVLRAWAAKMGQTSQGRKVYAFAEQDDVVQWIGEQLS